MKALGRKLILSTLATAGLVSMTAHAVPTIGSVSVSGYLKRASGTVVPDNSYVASIQLQSGGIDLAGCVDATNITVSSGYFTKQVACPAATMAAGTAGAITANVSITIGGTAETFTVTAYPVPTALVAGTALTVENGSIHNAKIAGTAAISLSKLDVTGATANDVIRYDGTNWAYTPIGSLNIATTNLANTYSNPQTMSGGAGITVATIGTSVVTGNETIAGNTTVTGAGTFGSVAVLNGVGIAAGLAVGGSQTVGGYLAVTGAGTVGSLAVTGDATVGGNLTTTGYASAAAGTVATLGATNITTTNVTASGYVSAAGGTIATLGATNLTASGYASAAAGTIATLGATNITASGHVNGALGTIGAAVLGNATDGVSIDTSAGNGAFSVNTGTGTINISNAATTAAAVNIATTGANGTVRVAAATLAVDAAKVRIGANGVAITSMGTCTFTQAITNAWANATCTSVPASVNVVVSCSPAAALSAAVAVTFRSTGAGNQIALRGTAAATSVAWNCMWFQP